MAARPAGTPGSPAADQALSPADGLAQLSFLISSILEHRAREHDLSIIQIRLLGVLRDRMPTMNELARYLDLDKSSVTGLVDRAQRRGLVVRVPSTADRRAVLVRLTGRGRALASAGAARFGADISLLLEHLRPTDRDTLSRLISRLLVAYAADHGVDLFATIDTGDPGSSYPWPQGMADPGPRLPAAAAATLPEGGAPPWEPGDSYSPSLCGIDHSSRRLMNGHERHD